MQLNLCYDRAMIKENWLSHLNPMQYEAVTLEEQNCLIIAGAGSGKTGVLAHRVAWLLTIRGLNPGQVLAVTFTNKAASEMRHRIEQLCEVSTQRMWVGTFHGLAHRMLRLHHEAAGLPAQFSILDSDDQLRLVKRLVKDNNLDNEKWEPKKIQWYINEQKQKGLRSSGILMDGDFYAQTMVKLYQQYEAICQQSALVDFNELLLRCYELVTTNNDIQEHYKQRFRHILVDEFQDTNHLQYKWLKALYRQGQNHMMAVGDDDQSIYSWRGAEIAHMHRFEKDYAPVSVVRLEQNYRSTQTILKAANEIISYNNNRLGKQLWSDGHQGDLITLYTAFNESDETYFIISRIQSLFQQGHAYKDIAILYRSNAQSRVLEERCIEMQIPYRIHGGQKFFDRAEIKDMLAYMRLLVNPSDDAAFDRVVNVPTRGIGMATIDLVREAARVHQCSLWQAAAYLIDHQALPARAAIALKHFIDLITQMQKSTEQMSLGEQVQLILEQSTLLAYLEKDRTQTGRSRLDNCHELITACGQYQIPEVDAQTLSQSIGHTFMHLQALALFLNHIALETGAYQTEDGQDAVSLMTLHAAKGLEFPIVFIAGLEENLFPHSMALEDRNGLEEERRLCYVGITRAKVKLYLTHAENRALYGRDQFQRPSRFLQEISDEFLDVVRPTARVRKPMTSPSFSHQFTPISSVSSKTPAALEGLNLQVGQRVSHPKFGTGVIMNYEGQPPHTRIQIRFDRAGSKWLVATFAKLEPC
jgi:DNA helicase-2/ATP-dependent DNA helicase PcrA